MKCIVPGKLLIVLAIILALIITACSALASEPYVCDVEAVESIQIARLLDFNENNHYRFEVDVICEISDVSAFAEQLNVIPQSTNWGEPYTMDIEDTIIVVNYPNGDADLLCADAQVFVRGIENQTGYLVFQREQFDALVEECLSDFG